MTHESDGSLDAAQLTADLAPTLNLLRTVAAEGHLTRAAHRLGIPQPTVSRTLARLADRLGTEIVTRDGRGVRLTRTGAKLAAAADDAYRELADRCREVVEELDPDRGRVALGFQHTMGGALVPELIRSFRTDHPGVRFRLVQGARDELLTGARDGRLDLCLVSPMPSGPEWEASPVTRDELVAVVHTDHRLAGRTSVRLADLAGEDFALLSSGYGLRRIVTELAGAAGVALRTAWEGEEVDTVRGLVAAGLGVTVLPRALGGAVAGTAEISLSPAAHRTVGIAWPAHRTPPPAVHAFREHAITRGDPPAGCE
ncbi:LysR family transcriptional regulator [Saccharopolyspora gloriosae]|uniref:DNA-binding transcriptional LysR family regulator n=1 Tax=Saccharopolyspora gloriosae TaxID=455344 RepID=A0A840N9C1_9PSEU|nr:DNA-binding transcriptional LysR family regulator [Saccharopolyspora gloriosae]